MVTKEEIKEEIMEMFYAIITGDNPDKVEVAEKLEAYWNNFLIQINRGYKYIEEDEE